MQYRCWYRNLQCNYLIISISLREECPYSEFFWSVFSRIQSKCGKMRTRETPNTNNFHAMKRFGEFRFSDISSDHLH